MELTKGCSGEGAFHREWGLNCLKRREIPGNDTHSSKARAHSVHLRNDDELMVARVEDLCRGTDKNASVPGGDVHLHVAMNGR